MYEYDPYPYTQMYATSTLTTTVPSYIEPMLMSRIHTERTSLFVNEERLRQRGVALRRIRAQQLREALYESDFEDSVEHVYEEEEVEEEDSDKDQAMRNTVYSSRLCQSHAKVLSIGRF